MGPLRAQGRSAKGNAGAACCLSLPPASNVIIALYISLVWLSELHFVARLIFCPIVSYP